MNKDDEPVAWGMKGEDGLILDVICLDEDDRVEGSYTIPLYTHPKEWVGLMEEEIREILVKFYAYNPRLVSFAQEIQAKLKEKNT